MYSLINTLPTNCPPAQILFYIFHMYGFKNFDLCPLRPTPSSFGLIPTLSIMAAYLHRKCINISSESDLEIM